MPGVRSILMRVAALLALTSVGVCAIAQTFPAKPVRLIVPFPAGGAVDTVARAVAQKLGEQWKQPILVENRAGAGGNIGADAVAKASPDGHTLLVTTNGLAISPSVYRKLPFDAHKDFAPLTQLTSSYLVLVSHPQFAATNVKDIIAQAKAKPGAIAYGSTGVGVAPHMVMEQFKTTTGTDLLHVPYKGDAQLNPALLSGEVQLAFMPTVAVVPHIKSGKLRGIAVTRSSRTAVLPDVPTVAESGLPGFEYAGWLGVFAPAGTPREIVGQVQRDMTSAVFSPELKDRLPSWGYDPVQSTPEQFSARYQSDLAGFARVVKEARIPVQD